MQEATKKVMQGNKELITTISLVTIYETPIEIELFPNVNIKIFFDDDKSKKQRIGLRVLNNVLQVELQNFTNPLGTSTKEPIEIGKIDNKTLFMHFIIHTIGESPKTRLFTCSFFMEDSKHE